MRCVTRFISCDSEKNVTFISAAALPELAEALEQLEDQQQIESETLPERAGARAPADKPWYQQAVNRARCEAGYPAEREQHREPDRDHRLVRDHERVLRRARAMDRTDAELDALVAVRDASPEARRLVEDLILEERMRNVRDREREEKLLSISPQAREKLEALRSESFDRQIERERELPVPDRELISQHELDQAQE